MHLPHLTTMIGHMLSSAEYNPSRWEQMVTHHSSSSILIPWPLPHHQPCNMPMPFDQNKPRLAQWSDDDPSYPTHSLVVDSHQTHDRHREASQTRRYHRHV